jgi:hypothetical protein
VNRRWGRSRLEGGRRTPATGKVLIEPILGGEEGDFKFTKETIEVSSNTSKCKAAAKTQMEAATEWCSGVHRGPRSSLH